MKTIDTCGLSCPQPVLLVHQAVKAGEQDMDVLVDNEASRENVIRAAGHYGLKVNAVEEKGGVCRLELRH